MSKGTTALHIGGKLVKRVKQNSDWLMMILAWLGLIGTTGLAINATIKAVKLCEEKEVQGTKEVIKATWKLYIPTVGCFIVTTLSVGGLGRRCIRRAKQLATVTGLYAMSQTDMKALKEKAKEVLGEKKEREKIEDELTKDKLNAIGPITEDMIINTGHGNKLFYEKLTGHLLRSSPEYVESVSENINNQISKQVDNIVEVSYYLNKFNLPTNCWVGDAFWDWAEMLQRGENQFVIDCHEIQWMEVNGQQEMVGVIDPPRPTGV